MLFNSYSFIFLFLPITYVGMLWLGRFGPRLASLWLGLASLTFYAVWDSRFVLLLIASIGFNYSAGYWIGLCRTGSANANMQAKFFTSVAIIANLALLVYFKYTNFFIDSVNHFFDGEISLLHIILPLGISFFTFTQIAFLVDVYRGIAREYNFIHYLLFVTWFPHLIAGPVLHHKQMMPQFSHDETYRINLDNIVVGLTVFTLGLAKKVLIADNLSEFATPIFAAATSGVTLKFFEAWVGALAYTLQLYFDFSGYSDMAIGLSLVFNVRLPLNFNSPYKAVNIIDFWRRWHMTLSSFLRDYLYIPLGGSQKGPTRRYINLMVTMLLGGLWHGAGWTFLVWGGLHGLYLMVNHGWRELKVRLKWREGGRLARLGSGALTFLAVVVAWVFFRADSFASALAILSGLTGLNGMSLPGVIHNKMAVYFNIDGISIADSVGGMALFSIFVGFFLVWFCPNVQQIMRNYRPTWEDMMRKGEPDLSLPSGQVARFLIWRPTASHAVTLGLLFYCCFISLNKVSEFLYFQF